MGHQFDNCRSLLYYCHKKIHTKLRITDFVWISLLVANYAHVNRYFYGDDIGAYLLVKIHELSDKARKQKQIKEIIKNAFIASSMDIDEYINMIEEECYKCRREINYVQKEKMKEYLMKTF